MAEVLVLIERLDRADGAGDLKPEVVSRPIELLEGMELESIVIFLQQRQHAPSARAEGLPRHGEHGCGSQLGGAGMVITV